jgi:chorismate mutase
MKRKPEFVTGVTAKHCVAALRARFKAPEFALFEQVANGVGWKANRWADAVAVGIWPSRGLLIHGFEIKVSRTDWKKELADPKKSEEVQGFCDHWHIVAPRGLIPTSELPPTWGLVEIGEKHASKVRVEAPKLKPKPVTREFMAAILRRASDAFGQVIQRERFDAREEGAQNGAGELAGRLKRMESERDHLSSEIAAFKEKSGVDIRAGWQFGDISEAVRVITSRRSRPLLEELKQEMERRERGLDAIRRDIDEFARLCKATEPAEAAQ